MVIVGYMIIMLPGGALSDGARLTSVCLSHTSALSKSRTERPRKTKIGTEVARVTRDSTFMVIRSKVNLQGRGHIVAASYGPTQLVEYWQRNIYVLFFLLQTRFLVLVYCQISIDLDKISHLLYGIHLWADLDRDRHVGGSMQANQNYSFL